MIPRRSRPDRVGFAALAVAVALLAIAATPWLSLPAFSAPDVDSGPQFASAAIDGRYPYPHPGPVRPISGTVVVVWPYPYPYWCTFPTPLPPPLPPGVPTPLPPTPVPSPTPGGAATKATYTVCPQIAGRVPAAVQQQALAEPWTVYGFATLKNPNVPYHPLWNPLRTELNLHNPNVPYSICNPVVWKSGCW